MDVVCYVCCSRVAIVIATLNNLYSFNYCHIAVKPRKHKILPLLHSYSSYSSSFLPALTHKTSPEKCVNKSRQNFPHGIINIHC